MTTLPPPARHSPFRPSPTALPTPALGVPDPSRQLRPTRTLAPPAPTARALPAHRVPARPRLPSPCPGPPILPTSLPRAGRPNPLRQPMPTLFFPVRSDFPKPRRHRSTRVRLPMPPQACSRFSPRLPARLPEPARAITDRTLSDYPGPAAIAPARLPRPSLRHTYPPESDYPALPPAGSPTPLRFDMPPHASSLSPALPVRRTEPTLRWATRPRLPRPSQHSPRLHFPPRLPRPMLACPARPTTRVTPFAPPPDTPRSDMSARPASDPSRPTDQGDLK